MGKNNRNQQPSPKSDQHADPLTGAWLHMVRAFLGSAMIITAYLALVTLTNGGGAPGCGPDSGCDQVLTSPWAHWLGIPVSLPGLALYGVFLISTFSLKNNQLEKARRSLNAQALCAFSILAAAIWFVGIQAFVIKAFCPYCCTAHTLASVASVLFLMNASSIGSKLSVKLSFARGASVGAALIAAVALIQIVFPKEQTAPEIVNLAENPTPETVQPKPAIETSQDESASHELSETVQPVIVNKPPIVERRVSKPLLIPRTNFKMETIGLPILGDLEAPHRIACIFDYTCHHCRNLHGFIRELLIQYEGQLSSLMIPMPLDANCNRLIKKHRRLTRTHVNTPSSALRCIELLPTNTTHLTPGCSVITQPSKRFRKSWNMPNNW
jgi:uncharacterized membrane protein